ncbi:DUF7373 family lipoprotein [Tsukamurella soli]|uniref:DUF7373 domain-containing protein n=1 Tax=Tsukamurella soli TaxID=644556 RepID=A0ABP8JK14_9ACTN
MIGLGASNAYRTRDAAGASLLAGRFATEQAQDVPGGSAWSVDGVPNSRCYTGKDSDSDPVAYCVVPVGRYVAEYTSPQPTKTKQAVSAAYLILRAATRG